MNTTTKKEAEIAQIKARLDQIYTELESIDQSTRCGLTEAQHEYEWYKRQQSMKDNESTDQEPTDGIISMRLKELDTLRDRLEKRLDELGGDIFTL